MSNYYLIIKGKQKGPYTAERMQGMWANKNIAPGTLCQKEGETGSRPIEQFSEITAPKPKPAPQKAATATPTTSAAQKTTSTTKRRAPTSTTGAWPLPLKYIIPALAVLLLVGVIAVVAIISSGGGDSAPVITRQPAGVTGSAGAAVSFDINATDASSYQWQKDGADIAGETAATLKLTNVQLKDNGTYCVVVSNDAGSVTSSGAVLAVTRPLDVTIANLTDEKKIAKAVGRVVVGWKVEDQSGAQEEYLFLPLLYTKDEADNLPRETQRKLRELEKPRGKYKYYEYVLGGTGTCFMITPDGYALTNRHVIESFDRILRANKKREKIKSQMNFEKITPIILVYFGASETRAKLVHVSSKYDLAILEIEGMSKAPYFALSNTDVIKRGDTVTALGFPGAADEEVSGAGEAIRRALRGSYKKIHELFPEEKCEYNQNTGKISAPSDKAAGRLIQHDAIINHGNSGGPLVDPNCTVLGINTFGITRGGSVQGIFLSLQMHQLKGEIDSKVPKAVWK